MKYLLIDSQAIENLINERQYQSVEFEAGRALVSFLRGSSSSLVISESVAALARDGGAYILAPRVSNCDVLVFDFEEMPGLFNLDDTGFLLAIQKTLRFCKKIWTGLTPSKHERILSDGKAVVFPYPIGLQTSLRLSIDRNPDAKRWSKRETVRASLVYKFSDNEGEGPKEVPRPTNFRKATDGRPAAQSEASALLKQAQTSRAVDFASLAVTALDSDPEYQTQVSGLANWRRHLTTSQLKFVESPLTAPHRIEGPAGTGKTLCLVLKALKLLGDEAAGGRAHKSLFVTHSHATKTTIQNLFATNGGEKLSIDLGGESDSSQSIAVTTLHELCAHLLHQEISDVELVDRDAYESKQMQKLYASEAVERALSNELSSHRPFLGPSFLAFLESADRWAVAEMLQHEISVQIKGRAEEDFEKYKKLPALKYGMPLGNEADKAFVFLMYEEYQKELEGSAQFDTDDVVLSANSQLSTPIWRRRRIREGYDSIFVDETHLFNLNELSIFHKLTRSETAQPIAYSVDRSQALGDRGWADEAFEGLFNPDGVAGNLDTANVRSIFRCSPEIIELALSVTSSGATLFTNFHNPLSAAVSAFSAEDERKCRKPSYIQYASDEVMFEDAFARADAMAKEMGVPRADVAVIAFGDATFEELRRASAKKPVEAIKSRGDQDAVNRAKQGNKYVLSAPEFVGGLEFAGVVLVGVDTGRVPPMSAGAGESQAFLNYAAHQKLYVAITRAKFQVLVLGNRARGISSALQSARAADILEIVD